MDLLTWNLQGRTTAGIDTWEADVKPLVLDQLPEVACFQEFGRAPDDDDDVRTVHSWPGQPVTLFEWNDLTLPTYYLLHYQWAEKRVNPALMWRADLTPTPNPAQAVVWAYSGIPDFRDAPGVQLRDGRTWYSVHASARNQGPNARALLENADTNGQPWVVAGDFNVDPDTLRTRLQRRGHDWPICPPNAPTHGTNCYDYLVRNAGAAVQGTVLGMSASDHDPVVFEGL